MASIEAFQRQSHPLRGLTYNIRRLMGAQSHIQIELPKQHLRFSLPAGSIFARLLYKYGEYEIGVSNWLIQHAEDLGPGLAIDVGANFGWYACLLHAIDSERQVLAFEPEQNNFALLQQQLQLNGARSVQAFNLGLGAEPGHLEMFKYKDGNSGRHSLLPLHDGQRVRVDIVTLDQHLQSLGLADQPIALIKMDIEGYEMFALRGALRALERTRRVILEYSPELMRQAKLDPKGLLDILEQQGFAARLFDTQQPSGARPVSFEELRALSPLNQQFDLLFESPLVRT